MEPINYSDSTGNMQHLRLCQLRNYFDSLAEDIKTKKEPMVAAAIHCILYALSAAKMQTTEPFKPVVQTHEYTGKCRRNTIRPRLCRQAGALREVDTGSSAIGS